MPAAGARILFNHLADVANRTEFVVASISTATTLAHLAYRNTKLQGVLGATLLATSDRRIAVEVGCSLPIVNNPMVDHGLEHPDFTLGRWIWNSQARLSSLNTAVNMEFSSIAPSIYEFQNATDRVQFHSLMPQDKIHTLRLKLYCRIRTYNAARDRFDMETIVMPMTHMDWWHCRVHFVSKD